MSDRRHIIITREGCAPVHNLFPEGYPLYPGDVLSEEPGGTWFKQTGLGMSGFPLTDEQVQEFSEPFSFEGKRLVSW